MALVETWDETKPAGSRDRSLGDDDIREFKRAIAERLNVGHVQPSDESGEANVGHHRSIKMVVVETSDPANAANVGWLYLKDVSSVIELFFEDESGNAIQLTSGGLMNWGRASDLLLSANTNTPAGWTDVSTTYDNKFIRIGDDTPLTTTGGSDTHDHGAATGSTTLSAAQSGLPSHTHTIQASDTSGGASTIPQKPTSQANNATITTEAAGGSAASSGHTHSIASADNVPAYIQTRMYKKD
jgi:hypothetical protein